MEATSHIVAQNASPISNLPNEVLLHIITLTLPLTLILDTADRCQLQTLRCICASWRDLCFVTKALWSGLHISLDAPRTFWSVHRPQRKGSCARKLEGWFVRAEAIPVTDADLGEGGQRDASQTRAASDSSADDGPDLRLVLEFGKFPLPAEEQTHIEQFIRRNMGRWSELTLHVMPDNIQQIFVASEDTSPPVLLSPRSGGRKESEWTKLTSLHISYSKSIKVMRSDLRLPHPSDDRTLVEILAAMPILHTLRLADPFFQQAFVNLAAATAAAIPSSPRLPKFHQIRHLNLTISCVPPVFAFLACLPGLETLKLIVRLSVADGNVDGRTHDFQPPVDRLRAHNITALTIDAHHLACLHVLPTLALGASFPALRALSLNMEYGIVDEGGSNFLLPIVPVAVHSFVAKGVGAGSTVAIGGKRLNIEVLITPAARA